MLPRHAGCGMDYEATMYLPERGVRITGIDGELGRAVLFQGAEVHPDEGSSLIW